MKRQSYLSSIKRKWTGLVIFKIVLASLIPVLAIVVVQLSFAELGSWSWLLGWLLLSGLCSFLVFRKQLPDWDQVKNIINQQAPEVEYSISILDVETVGLAQLQQERVLERLLKAEKKYRFPINLHETLYFLIIGIAVLLFTELKATEEPEKRTNEGQNAINERISSSEKDSTIYNWRLKAKYPSYTKQKSKHLTSLHIEHLPEGSTLTWNLQFNNPISSVWLTFSNGDSLIMQGENQRFSATAKIVEKGYYQLLWEDSSGMKSSEYYRLMTLPDSPPEVSISNIPQYQKITVGESQTLDFVAKASDNYGLRDAFITATVTKGSGESVKFREVIIPFSNQVSGKSFEEEMTFTMSQFDLEPGNELYFYFTATDNHTPQQSSKTETFFFILEDTTEVVFSLEGDLGIDQMPAYFRSQRQIIIDSEKLLAERPTISKEEFNRRSNELGFNQKALRLKYGQFLGEEANSGLDIENEVEEEPDVSQPGEVDVLSVFGHDHDHENEEGQHMDKGAEHQEEDVIAALSHSHDTAEEATFFEASLKSKLKGALSEMWDAELYLRLYDPQQSLPYQYKALKLIKEIKNHARIYVQRIGFDPPPINEAKSRLTGDLEEIAPKTNKTTYQTEESMQAVKNLIAAIDQLLIAGFPVANQLKSQMLTAGNEIAALAIEEPIKYLPLLSDMKSIAELEAFSDDKKLMLLKYRLLAVIEKKGGRPILENRVDHPLMDQFVEELLKSK
jgi:hypothetical protein